MLHESAGVDKDQQRKEISRVGDYWHKHGKGMSKDELIDAISNDFEQLEYSPEEVEKMTDAVLRILRVPGA
jgi:hypothetical protein